jgi:hypothetical protein
MISYVAKNIRHVHGKAAEWIDCSAIRIFSRVWSERVQPAQWHKAHSGRISAPGSLISILLAKNERAVPDAQAIVRGRHRVLGRPLDVGDGMPDWHADHFSNARFPLLPYRQYGAAPDSGIDIVVPWETSRIQFVPTLVQAHRETGDARYADYFFRLLSDWSGANPYLMGVNWSCGLDVAVRALQIALGIVYLISEEDPRFAPAVRLLWLHLLYLQERDLYVPRSTRNNHLLVAVALQYALLHLFRGDEAERWKSSARGLLQQELTRQFRPDGGNVESAMQYHQFSLEAVLVAVAFAAAELKPGGSEPAAAVLGAECNARIFDALSFSADCARVWGGAPGLGDSSDARVLMHRAYRDWTASDPFYLADWSELLYRERDPFTRPGSCAAKLYAQSGLALYRAERYGVLVCAMPVTAEAGGHNHFDKASLLLQIAGCPVLVDSGTYCYTSDSRSRREFRQGRAHNVVLIDGLEQGHSPGGGAFDVPEFGETAVEALDPGGDTVALLARHDGYRRIPGLGRVSRTVRCHPRRVEVLDTLDGAGRHEVEIVFNLAPAMRALCVEGGAVVHANDAEICRLLAPPRFEVSLEPRLHSEHYMQTCATQRLVLKGKVALPCVLETVIALAEGGDSHEAD